MTIPTWRRWPAGCLLGTFLAMLLPTAGFTEPSAAHEALLKNQGWTSFGGVASGGQYSALDEINRANVKGLERAWTSRTGDVVEGPAIEGGSSFEGTPIYWGGKLYVCTPMHRVLALEPDTGKVIWRFDALSTLAEPPPRFAANCRGVSLWVDPDAEAGASCRARIIKPDIFARLIAIDAQTGKACEGFGDKGVVRLNDLDNGGEGDLYLTSPPAVLGNLIITGSVVGDNIVANAADGYVRAFDARTGKLAWSFNPIPVALSDKTGGSNVWSLIAVDEERQLVFLPTSSPSVDPYGVNRTEPIPLANAVVALDGRNGEVVWSFQTVHHDLFDYDLPAQPILFDLKRDGEAIPAVAQITKLGFVFMLDRRTGEPLHPVEERPVPKSNIPNERASPTQPVPVTPAPFARQQINPDDMFGLTPVDKLACRRRFDALRYEGLFTPPSEQGSIQLPSALGGGNWGGASLDPRSNTLIVKTQNLATIMKLVPADPAETRPTGPPVEFLKKPLNQTPYRLDGEFFLSPLGIPCTPPPWGELVGIDLDSGEHLWRQPLGRYPITDGVRTQASWGSPNVGGPLATGGGLVFIGAGMDSTFRALDTTTGELLWQDEDLPAPAMAVPMTYQHDGHQYVVVAAGGNGLAETKQSDAIVAYRLGE